MQVSEFSIKVITICNIDLQALYNFDKNIIILKDHRNKPRNSFLINDF
jgi:hypothetical protein